MQFEGDAARLALRDGGRTLQPERAASSVRYTDGGTTVVWTHGEEARIEVDGETYEGCSADRPAGIEAAAALRGAEFRASGNEPGWYAEIDDGNAVTLVWDYGERRAVTPAPDAQTDESQRTIYDIETEAHTIRIVIADEPCVDDAGREYPSTVTLTIDDRTLIGCGRALEAYRPLS